MSATLIQQFNLLASSLGGVAKLRELILSLAVRGKLVPQNPADEPASVLLQKIRAEKERLITEGKTKKDKPQPPISDEEKPFELPAGWIWVRLPEIYYSISPSGSKLLSSLIEEEGQFPVVDQGKKYIAGFTNNAELLINLPGPVIIFGDHTTERKYVDFDFVAGADGVKILRPILQYERYFYWHLRSLNLEGRGYARHFKILNDNLFALPSFPEQSRIVTKVDELMALCDRLEAEQGQAARVQGHWVEAALAQLADSADANDFARHWQHLAQHFDTLFTTPDSITQLEATLLQLAVRGKLVPQDPSDEPASTLLQKIRTEKDRLIAEGKIKRDKPLKSPLPPFAKGGDVVAAAITSHHPPPLQKGGRGGFTHAISDEQAPLELPEGWEWVRLGDLLPDFQNGASSRGDNGGINTTVLRLADIRNGEICLNDTREIPINRDHIEKYSLKAGDVLITRVNGSADLIGRFTLALEDLDAIYCDHFIRMRIDNCVITPQFLKILGDSQLIRDRISSLFITTAGQKTVNQGHITSLQLPLAPFAEQSRIVAKLESLFALTAGLKTQLAKAQQMQALLADVLLETST